MKIVVVGTRGIPNIQGGVETHCEKLYPILAKEGLDITLVRRTCYLSTSNKHLKTFKEVKLKNIYAPKIKSLEAIIHTFLGILYAKKIKADVVHIHAIGPGLLAPIAKLLGIKVVVTHHSLNYFHSKWNYFAKYILKIGEAMVAKYADNIIVVSSVLQESLSQYGRVANVKVIYNGVTIPVISNSEQYINSLGLQKYMYIIALGRFVEDKGFHNLIEAYTKSNVKNKYKLVIAGDADHETEYSKRLKAKARICNVILPGFIKGEQLNELMSHAALFILPSFHEGLPISLLEAMSYKLDVIVSAIPPNIEIGLDSEDYFSPNNLDELQLKLETKLLQNKVQYNRKYNLKRYNWNIIAEETKKTYEELN